MTAQHQVHHVRITTSHAPEAPHKMTGYLVEVQHADTLGWGVIANVAFDDLVENGVAWDAITWVIMGAERGLPERLPFG